MQLLATHSPQSHTAFHRATHVVCLYEARNWPGVQMKPFRKQWCALYARACVAFVAHWLACAVNVCMTVIIMMMCGCRCGVLGPDEELAAWLTRHVSADKVLLVANKAEGNAAQRRE
jgi:hypothetical protein